MLSNIAKVVMRRGLSPRPCIPTVNPARGFKFVPISQMLAESETAAQPGGLLACATSSVVRSTSSPPSKLNPLLAQKYIEPTSLHVNADCRKHLNLLNKDIKFLTFESDGEDINTDNHKGRHKIMSANAKNKKDKIKLSQQNQLNQAQKVKPNKLRALTPVAVNKICAPVKQMDQYRQFPRICKSKNKNEYKNYETNLQNHKRNLVEISLKLQERINKHEKRMKLEKKKVNHQKKHNEGMTNTDLARGCFHPDNKRKREDAASKPMEPMPLSPMATKENKQKPTKGHFIGLSACQRLLRNNKEE